MEHHVNVGIVVVESLPGGFHLGPAHIALLVKDLALEVAQVHSIEVNDSHGAHTREGQVYGRGRAKTTRSNYKHLCIEKTALPLASTWGMIM